MEQGRIIRSLSGFYDVDNGQEIVRCRAKGSFRQKKITPLVGDEVSFVPQGRIEDILPRRNRLIRPPVSNVDQAVIVFAAVYPEPHPMLLEHFLVMVHQQGIRPVICLNKRDQVQAQEGAVAISLAENYRKAGFCVLCTSTRTGEGIEKLKAELAGKVSVLAGHSGVGKSSLLNALIPGLSLETGSLSEKIQRGKNTTRCAQLLRLEDEVGFVADTAGFTSLRLTDVTPQTLADAYPEFAPYREECYFPGCSHISEPECGVRRAVETGLIVRERYEGYRALWQELKAEEQQETTK